MFQVMQPKILKPIFIVLFILGSIFEASATDQFQLNTSYSKGYFNIGMEAAVVSSSSGESLTGFGPKVGADWDLGNSMSISPAVSFVSTTSGNYLYTGLSGYLRYSLWGDILSMKQNLTYKGIQIYQQQSSRVERLTLGLGVEQLFLSGTQSVYSAAGPSASMNYYFYLYNVPFETSVRYTALVASGQNLSGVFFNFSYIFD